MIRLNWKFREFPTAEGLAALVTAGVISAEEARLIAFGVSGDGQPQKKKEEQ